MDGIQIDTEALKREPRTADVIVRLPPSTRDALNLAAIAYGRPVQHLLADAIDQIIAGKPDSTVAIK